MADDTDNGANSQDNSEEIEADVGEDSVNPPPTSELPVKYGVYIDDLAAEYGVSLPEPPPPDRGPPRPRVAFYITLTLLAVFAIQVLSLTFSYLLLVSSVFIFRATDAIEMELVTEAILQGVQVIVPVTTTLLGVAIGYYFKEEVDERAKQGEDEDEEIDL